MKNHFCKKAQEFIESKPKTLQDRLSAEAWDICCDGEALDHMGHVYSFDPWDLEHEDIREEIELEALSIVFDDLMEDF